MTRTLTAVATATCIAPLVGIGAGYFFSTDPFPAAPGLTGTDRGIGVAVATYVGGFLAGALAFAATYKLTRAYLPDAYLRPVQIADAAGVAALLVWGFAAARSGAQHDPPAYPGQRATLDVEIRAPKTLLDGFPVTVLNAFLDNGKVDATRHAERIRDEGDSLVLPYELEVLSLHDWTVKVYRTSKQSSEMPYWFKLALPRSPKGSVPWSEWIAPIPKNEWAVSDGVRIRYRWKLSPENAPRDYQP
ncbi:MAG: hypothetical protein LAP38_01885 [Acidobacteriia bacterium]|nr:hypothetical protein [Terriglobia bacterium]